MRRGRDSRERPIDILLIEDKPGDVRLIEEVFNETPFRNELHVVTTGTDALDFLHQRGDWGDAPTPDILFVDLNLPGMSGIEILQAIKDEPVLKVIPAIVLTSSKNEEDIVKSYEQHANAYLTKPADKTEFMEIATTIGEFWIQMVKLPPTDD